ncbi:MAG: DUF1836 domain-containing protein [Lachnospiraceae bacterium]|nr:DUF1836 domain-containing protein [Lachnospiraceae bacterium]
MSVNTQNIIDEVINSLELINADDIPAIDLYMDQVTTFMEKHLKGSKRYESDKILTKTMINNYAKNNLIPSPEKKRYSKEHVLMLVFIYYFKNIMSINDIKTLLNPISDKYFHQDSGMKLEDIYKEVCTIEKDELVKLKSDLKDKLELSATTFMDCPENEKKFLQLFSMICALSYDVYVKKQLIENIIDAIAEEKNSVSDSKKDNKK